MFFWIRRRKLPIKIKPIGEYDPDAKGKLVVAVHPYYQSHPENSYLQGLNALIASQNGPLITLEESDKLSSTMKRYRELGRKKGAYFIETNPAELSFDDVAEFIRYFRKTPVTLIGGYYSIDTVCSELLLPRLMNGCMGKTVYELARRGIDVEIPLELTFSWKVEY